MWEPKIRIAMTNTSYENRDIFVLVASLTAVSLPKNAVTLAFQARECQLALTYIDFTLSNARQFYSSLGNPLGRKGLKDFSNIKDFF